MAFVLQEVIEELEVTRSLEPLKRLKKENLVNVAVHFVITPAAGATKFYIFDYCFKNNIIYEVEKNENAEVLKLKLELERLALDEA